MATATAAAAGQVTPKRKPVFVKVEDLKPGTSGHTLIVKVVETTPVKTSQRPKSARTLLSRPAPPARIAECVVGDETGTIIFTARNEQVDVMKHGVTVILRNAKIVMLKRRTMRLAVDKWGRMEVTEAAKFEVKEDNNLSLVEYELVTVSDEATTATEATAAMAAEAEEVQLTYRRSSELLASTTIIQYCKFKILREIMPALERHGVLQDFAATCFAHFLNFDAHTVFSSKLVSSLLAKEIVVDGVGGDELYFVVGGRRLRFSKYEFCLLSGLKFGGGAHFPAYNNDIVEGGVLQRYWPTGKVDLVSLQTRLCEENAIFSQREDVLKMALVLFVERFLFGADYRKFVSPWLFSLVENMEQFNSFPWGKFVFQMTLHYLKNATSARTGKDNIRCHFYGFPIIFQIWAYEAIPWVAALTAKRNVGAPLYPRCLKWKMGKKRITINDDQWSNNNVFETLEATPEEMVQPYWVDIEDNLADGIQFVENHAQLTESTEGSPQRPAKKKPRFSRVLETHIRIPVSPPPPARPPPPPPPARPPPPPPPAVVGDSQFESIDFQISPPSTPAAPVSHPTQPIQEHMVRSIVREELISIREELTSVREEVTIVREAVTSLREEVRSELQSFYERISTLIERSSAHPPPPPPPPHTATATATPSGPGPAPTPDFAPGPAPTPDFAPAPALGAAPATAPGKSPAPDSAPAPASVPSPPPPPPPSYYSPPEVEKEADTPDGTAHAAADAPVADPHTNMELDACTPQSPSPRVNRDKKVSQYLRSPYVHCDQTGTYQQPEKRRYGKFKKGRDGERFVGLILNADADFFKKFEAKSAQLEDHHINAYMCLLAKRIGLGTYYDKSAGKFALGDVYFFRLLEDIWKADHPNYEEDDDQPVTSLPVADADHLVKYVTGETPEWGEPWWSVDHVLLVVVSHEHWMTLKIDLKDWTIYIFDSISYRAEDEGWRKERRIMPLRAILPFLLQKAGYFQRAGIQPRMDIFKAVLVPSEESAKQIDDNSCGVFCLSFLDSIIRGLSISGRTTQAIVDKLRKDYAFEIFLNSTNPSE